MLNPLLVCKNIIDLSFIVELLDPIMNLKVLVIVDIREFFVPIAFKNTVDQDHLNVLSAQKRLKMH